MTKIKRWWWVLLLVPVLASAAFVVWAESPSEPMLIAEAALEAGVGTDGVLVDTEPWLTFQPALQQPTTGLIFYPGGRVHPRAYGPPAREIAGEGYLVVIAPMPLNLAVLAPDRAQAVIAAFPMVTHWVIGGHSLGGAMAARFVHRNPAAVDALVLWASYPAASDDLSDRDVPVTTIYSTRDGLATTQEILASQPLLPLHTRWVRIEGGNHAQFGWYGPQKGDNQATISRHEQQRQVTAATIALLDAVGR